MELTVPWEDRTEEAHEQKLERFQTLILESQQRGWRALNLPMEVGCRGFPGQSLWGALGVLGVRGSARKKLAADITRRVEVASRWLGLTRNKQ